MADWLALGGFSVGLFWRTASVNNYGQFVNFISFDLRGEASAAKLVQYNMAGDGVSKGGVVVSWVVVSYVYGL